MNRQEYINRLKMALQDLPLDELNDILSDYEEHFDIGVSKGKSEEEISKELGDPREVASNYRTTFKSIQYKNNMANYQDDGTRRLLVALLLIGFNVIVVLVPYLTLLGFLLGIYGAAVAFGISGFIILFGVPITIFTLLPTPHFLTSLSFGIGLIALGGLGILLGVYLTKQVYKLTLRYINWNIDLINRGGQIQ